MSRLLALVLFAIPLTQVQAKEYFYACECLDTGVECDGLERMNVAVNGAKATIDLGSRDWDASTQYKTTRDPGYSPTKNKGFDQYKIASGDEGFGYSISKSTFLIEKDMINGTKSGKIKFQSFEDGTYGGLFYSWLYRCARK